mmetsp:Transcript_4155/g.13384  ORF Transcript_4155/g.13384 Transcript_4155/m.13384 type:complete len:478 (+) Transcript_4155:362-1795(+)
MVELVARLVHALEGVGAEEVTLRLDQVGRQAGAAVLVKVGEGGGHGGAGDAGGDAERDDAAPGGLALVDVVRELWVHQQRGQVGVAVVRLLDAVEEDGADDAAALPDAGALAQVHAPPVLAGRLADQVHALRVGADLGRVQRLAHVVHQLLAVHLGEAAGGALEHSGRLHALVLERAHEPRVQRRADGRARHPLVGGLLDRHLARALVAGRVQDLVQQLPLASLQTLHVAVRLGEDLARDLDQERVQLRLVPLLEHLRQLRIRQPRRAEHIVRLCDQLHVPILDPVVHHLDVVATARAADVRRAWTVVHLRRHLEQNRLQRIERLLRAARHERGAVARAVLATRHAHRHVLDAARLQQLGATNRVLVPFVTAVDQDVTGLGQLREQLDRRVHRRARLDHEQDPPRLAQRRHKLVRVLVPLELVAHTLLLRTLHAIVHLGHRTVAHGHVEPLGRDVQGNILAHHGQAIDANLGNGGRR